MARQGIGMGRTIWGEARMSATYFNKRGDGHSIRGTMAREQGAVAWSKLPATLRRGLSIRDAIDAEISASGITPASTPPKYMCTIWIRWKSFGESSTRRV